MKKLISIITPLYNEEENLAEFKERIERVFTGLHDYEFEVLLIDNCSTDSSLQWCLKAASENTNWKYIRFSRNFNSEASIATGYYYAKGDAAIVVFSDLQDPPELIPEFINKWENGCDVVNGVVEKRSDANLFYKFASKLIYILLYLMSSPRITKNATDFKLLDRAVINALNTMEERVRYSRGLIHWSGYKNGFISYDREPRKRGKSHASVWYRISFAINAITSFTVHPLRLILYAGTFLMFLSACLILYRLYIFFTGQPIPGNTTTYILLLVALSWQGITIGVLGEYLANVLQESKKRPRWIIAHMENFSKDEIANTVRRKNEII